MDGHLSSLGWSPTSQGKVVHQKEVTLCSQNQHQVTTAMDGASPSPGWSPTMARMVIHHSKYDHQPSKLGSPILQISVPKDPKDDQTPSPGGSPTIQSCVSHQPKEGHPPSTIISMMTNQTWSFTLDNNNNNKNNPHLNFLKGKVLWDKEQGEGIRDKDQGIRDEG